MSLLNSYPCECIDEGLNVETAPDVGLLTDKAAVCSSLLPR